MNESHASDFILTAPEALDRSQSGDVTLIDIRTPREWMETGVAPTASLINLYHPDGAEGFANEIFEQTGGDKSAPIALICRTGGRSAQAAAYLRQIGYTQVYDVSEGMVGGPNGPGWLTRNMATTPPEMP